MALPSVAYTDYESYGGGLPEEAFKASLRAARASVREVIGFNEPQDAAEEEAYRNAVCAAVDVDAKYGASGGIGERMANLSIGSFSVSSSGEGVSAYDMDMRRCIAHELVGTSLLYQGIG